MEGIEKIKMLPNTTQVPNVIIDQWMPRLKDTEFRVLLIVVRQTLGWIEDVETGRRKDRDWISRGQLMHKSGRGHSATAAAVDSLIKQNLIEALNENGDRLDTPDKRQKEGSRIYYRFNTIKPVMGLFDTLPKSGKVVDKLGKKSKQSKNFVNLSENQPGRKVDTTKETQHTKELNTMQIENQSAPILLKGHNPKENIIGKVRINKDTMVIEVKGTPHHKEFMDFWYKTVQRTRNIEKPIITGADGKNLKRILSMGIDEMTLEQLALFFLADYSFKKFSPSISTFTSSGILTGLMNRLQNDSEFRKNLDRYVNQYLRDNHPDIRTADGKDMKAALQSLMQKYSSAFGKMTIPQEI
jgi:hypothetical protein